MTYAITQRTFEDFDTAPWFDRMGELVQEIFPSDAIGRAFGTGIMLSMLCGAGQVVNSEPSGLREGSALELPTDLANDQVEDFVVGATVKAFLVWKAEKAGVSG